MEGHTVKTDEEWQCIHPVAKHRCQTAALLCKQVQAQFDQLAERRYRLQKSLDQLRKDEESMPLHAGTEA